MTRIVKVFSASRSSLLLAGVVTLVVAVPLTAQETHQKTSAAMLAAFKSVVAGPSESTVRVLCENKEAALGTIIAEDGWILTKASELKGKNTLCKLKDGRTFSARVVGVEEANDLAMLKIEAKGLRPIEWRESKSAEVGNWVASPGTTGVPVCFGVVSVATRKPGPGQLPLSARARNSGYLGVGLEDAEGAAKIGMISPRSPAAQAGLKVGDLVIKVEGAKVAGREELIATIQRYVPGKTIVLEVKRGSEVKEIKAKLGKRPPDRGDMQNNMGSKLSERRDGFPVILQNDQVIKPTDCGGPLVDLDGKAVGLNIARAGRVESYAIPTESVLALIGDLKSGKLAPKPEPPPPTLAELENALKNARAEILRNQAELKATEDLRKTAEAKKKALEEQLADLKKKESEAQNAVDKAKKDATKK